ncbi:MAG: orotidine-5'-phosphate decarboxylase [Pseudomonadota bacterium]
MSPIRPEIPTGERLIVALDVPMGAPNALGGAEMAQQLGRSVLWYKIGLGMLSTGGMALAIELMEQGAKIFLDLKLFDIDQTIENAVRGVAGWAPNYLTVHGDPAVVRAAVAGRGGSDMKILAITVLTSLDRSDLDAMMIREGDLGEIAVERARRALEAGADGVIASPQEAAAIRALPAAAGKLIVTPGVRPAGSAMNDQKRVATPAEAIAAGADQVVIGRPIIAADDPTAAARAIQAEIAGAEALATAPTGAGV